MDTGLDSVMEEVDEYAGTRSSITYSTTISNQRVVNEGSGYKVTYTASCGTQGMCPINSKQRELSTDASIVPAIFHDHIRAELIAIANEGGEYSLFPLFILILHC